MSRSRNLKPAFFKNEDLAEVKFQYRLLFQGLWCLADREGRLENRPKRIKAELFPYDNVDIEIGLSELEKHGFVTLYDVGGSKYIEVNNFRKHQNPHCKESASTIPAPCAHHASRALTLNPLPSSLVATEQHCPESATPPAGPQQVDEVLLTFPVNGTNGTAWDFRQSLCDELKAAFPALDVLQQVRSALAWVKANPSRKKTPTGMRRFITGWLTKAQNRGDGGNWKPGVRPQSEGRPPVELVKAEDSEAAHRRWLESRKRQGLPTNGPARLGHNLRLIDPPEATS